MNVPSGKAHVDVLEVVLAGALDDQTARAARSSDIGCRTSARRDLALRGDWSAPGSTSCRERYWPVSDVFGSQHLLRRALGGDLAAAVAGAGAEVEQIIGGGDHFAVVLDQDQRVAEVAQVLQGLEQPAIVARVQADGRLVEDVEHAGQAAADLAGQANALRFAAGQRRRRPAQASDNPGRHRPGIAGDCGSRAAARRPPAAGPSSASRSWKNASVSSQRPVAQARRCVWSCEAAGGRVVAQPRAVAGGAGHLADEMVEPLPIDEADARRLVEGGNRPLY